MPIQKGFKKIKKIIEISLVAIIATILVVAATLYLCKDNLAKVPASFETIQLTKSPEGGYIDGVEWSRNKKLVAFVRSKKEGQKTVNSLWVVDKNGGNERKVIEMDDTSWGGLVPTFHWMPDNRRIGFLVGIDHPIETPEKVYMPVLTQIIKTIDINTGRIEELIHESKLGDFSWSPNGKRFVYWKGNEIWISSPDGKNRKKLVTTLVRTEYGTESSESSLYSPFIWSPDSKKFLVELRYREKGYVYQVDIAKGLFENLMRLSNYPARCKNSGFSPQWTPDKKNILFSTYIETEDNTAQDYTILTPKYTTWMFNIKTKSIEELTEGENFFCSPDGKKIVYWKGEWESSTATNTDTASHLPLPPVPLEQIEKEVRKDLLDFSKKDIQPISIPPILTEPPILTRKGGWHIMDINSRQIQKLPITADVESDNVIWISKDTISYKKTLNGISHIFLGDIGNYARPFRSF